MKRLLGLTCWLLVFSIFAATEEEETTLTKVGQTAPEFRVTTLDGKIFDLKDAKGKVVEVKFGAGLKLEVNRPLKLFGGGGKEGNVFDLKKLKTDSDAALRIATSLELLKPLTLKNTQMWLSRGDDGLVWKVRIWAAKLNDATATADNSASSKKMTRSALLKFQSKLPCRA